ncbi:MAG: hypothetical protein ACMXYC_01135 [Candidatus Woesearchaeota archaeon]
MKSFVVLRKEGLIRKITPNAIHASSLLAQSEKKLQGIALLVTHIEVNESTTHLFIDQLYDCFFQLIRSKMYKEGYKTLSHEAEISYIKHLGLLPIYVDMLDELRKIRNGHKYYGHQIAQAYVAKWLTQYQKIYAHIKELCVL